MSAIVGARIRTLLWTATHCLRPNSSNGEKGVDDVLGGPSTSIEPDLNGAF